MSIAQRTFVAGVSKVAGEVMGVDALLGLVCEPSPCGPNLEYDAEFQDLEVAARGKPEQEIGDKRVPAVPPNWQDVRESAQALFGKTKDLRVAILWARASIVLSGVAGLRDGIALISGLLDSYWDTVHPLIDPDDKDAGFRLNVVAGLVDSDTMLREVRRAVIADVPRKGRVTVFDVLVVAGKLQPGSGESAKTLAEVKGLLLEVASEPETLQVVGQASTLVTDLQKLLTAKVGSALVPDFAPLQDLIAPAAEFCRVLLAEAVGESGEGAVGEEGQDAQRGSGGSAVIRSRDDAIHMLDRVCEYVERSEPTSPAPLLIRRAQRLMSKNFVEIIEDLTPDSLAAIKALGGIKD